METTRTPNKKRADDESSVNPTHDHDDHRSDNVPTSKTNFVCIHGQESTSHVWDQFRQRHKEKSHQVITFDLSGHGVNPNLTDSFSFETYMQELDDVIREHRLTRFTLVAHSMGGRLAVVYASRHPEIVEQLLLLDCKLSPNKFKPGSAELVTTLKSIPTCYRSQDELNQTFLKLGYPLRKLQRWKDHGTVFEDQSGWHVTVSPYVGYLMRQEILSSTLPWEALALLKCPVSLFLATAQSIVTEESLREMKQLCPNLHIQKVAQSTHQNIIDRFCDCVE